MSARVINEPARTIAMGHFACFLYNRRGVVDTRFLFFKHRRCVINKKFDRRPPSKKDEAQLNEEIRDEKVRLIGSDNSQIGIVTSEEALRIAMSENLDLVKIVEEANPPVCKVMDYGKYRYEKQKKEKERKKNQKIISVKEIRLSVNIEQHDFDTKARNTIKFLNAGDKVKITLRMWGRQLGAPEQGIRVVEEFIDYLAREMSIDVQSKAKLEGRNINAIIQKG